MMQSSLGNSVLCVNLKLSSGGFAPRLLCNIYERAFPLCHATHLAVCTAEYLDEGRGGGGGGGG